MGPISSISSSDSARTHESYSTWENIIPLPPPSLLWSVGGFSLEVFLVVADAWRQAMAPYIQEDTTVLDIGCGCGRTARNLVLDPRVRSYVGFDIIPENIDWCRRFVEPHGDGRAQFLHFDLYSAAYRPQGTLRASDLVFPAEAESVDLIIAASLFTHLLEHDAIHYLNEIGRVLSGRGHALLSIHTDVPPGEKFVGDENRIDVDPSYFVQMASRAGLKFEREMELCGQTLVIFSRASKTPRDSVSTLRYLDLLKKSVLGELYAENELRILYLRDCLRETDTFSLPAFLNIRTAKRQAFEEYTRCQLEGIQYGNTLENLGFQNTMIGRRRLENIDQCLRMILRDKVPGDCIECGVWRGGATLYMRGFLAAHNVFDKVVWLADSFGGPPPPSVPQDQGLDVSARHFPMLAVDLETVQDLFDRYGLLDKQVKFLKGWFRDTLPSAPIQQLALLRVDGVLYSSTSDALTGLYRRLVPGGFVIVDDYGCLPQCRQAVIDFRERNSITEPIQEIDWTGIFWRKTK